AKYMANSSLQAPNATYTYNNVVTNGDFSNGTTGWAGSNATISVSNNTLSVTGTGSFQNFFAYSSTSINATDTHKYYVKAKMFVTNNISTSISIKLDTSSASSYIVNSINSPVQNQWYTLSGILTWNGGYNTQPLRVLPYNTYADATTANGKVMQVQQVQVIDLTATFGAGNEPSQAWCDANLPFVATSGTTSAWVESSQTNYTQLATLDNSSYSISTNVNGVKPQELYQWNLIRAFEDVYGTIPTTGTDTASKVNWLKNNVSKVTCNAYGYGVSPLGNKAYLDIWANSAWTGSTGNTSNNTVSLYSRATSNISTVIDSNGFVYFIAYTDASDGTTASTIYTDYIQLQLTFKPSIQDIAKAVINDVYRKGTNELNWTRIAKGIANNGSYTDYTPTNGQSYQYKITGVGSNGTTADSNTISTSTSFRDAQLSLASDYSQFVNLKYNPSRQQKKSVERAMMKFAGRTDQVAEFGEHDSDDLALSFTVLDINDLNMLQSLIESRQILLYRDNRGRRIFCTVDSLDIVDEIPNLWTVSFTINKTSYQEAV
ncbi:hypothetical protein ACPUYX_20805, partial [Desulfosporosinus sp. SYSU MS00001]|uniref:hypothetical protein n=1 Tax=Desulfosporosinus sp. SYSU MS00001 TaxID=3416284 RepID=UPI003CF0F7CE